MDSLPLNLYTAAQVRELDQRAASALGIASYELMSRAGAAAFALLRQSWPDARRILVACGPGNNGGDGYVLARLARAAGCEVIAASPADAAPPSGDARRALDAFVAAGGEVRSWDDEQLRDADLVVDALFGTGLSRAATGAAAECIRGINRATAPVLALDVPSGLHADTGLALGDAVIADATIAFVGLKLGFYVGAGPDYRGQIYFDGLGAPAAMFDALPPAAVRIGERDLNSALPARRRTSHKGAHGRVLVIGGGRGMPGAVRLAGEAALRAGAGLVTVATRAEHVGAIVSARPELICRAVEHRDELTALMADADVLALGPGLGQDPWAREMFSGALESAQPIVIDADGLNLLALQPRSNPRWILTPHPGEAGRLLGWATAQVQADRLGAARALADRYDGVIALKGAGTIVLARQSRPAICDRGNPGMASPGMGDVLTGVVAAILAQGAPPELAARVGVLVHAMAGDLAARRGERGLLASDLFAHLTACVNPV